MSVFESDAVVASGRKTWNVGVSTNIKQIVDHRYIDSSPKQYHRQ